MADKRATRQGLYHGLVELGKKHPEILAVDADLAQTTGAYEFYKVFPERYINCGIAEQNLIGMSAGLARVGFVPFCSSMAVFAIGRGFEIIRNSVAYAKLNVKVVGSHGGITAAGDGGTHQAIEDFSAMKGIPEMVIFSPCDYNQAFLLAKLAYEYDGPMYIRTSREPTENITPQEDVIELGKAQTLRTGDDLCIVATGMMSVLATRAATALSEKGVEATILNIHTLKPFDSDAVIAAARSCGGRVLVCEEANIIGGLGESVARALVEEDGIIFGQVGVNDRFGQSGLTQELLEAYGITSENIERNALALMQR